MGELDRLDVWKDPAIREALAWYREVAENRRPAKFRIAATIPVVATSTPTSRPCGPSSIG